MGLLNALADAVKGAAEAIGNAISGGGSDSSSSSGGSSSVSTGLGSGGGTSVSGSYGNGSGGGKISGAGAKKASAGKSYTGGGKVDTSGGGSSSGTFTAPYGTVSGGFGSSSNTSPSTSNPFFIGGGIHSEVANNNYESAKKAYDDYVAANAGNATDELSNYYYQQGLAPLAKNLEEAEKAKNMFTPNYSPNYMTSAELNGTSAEDARAAAQRAADIANQRGQSRTNYLKTYMTEDSNWTSSKYLTPEPTTPAKQSQAGDSFSRALENQQKPNDNIFAQDYAQMQADIAAEPPDPNKPYEKDYEYATPDELLDMDRNDSWSPTSSPKKELYPWEKPEQEHAGDSAYWNTRGDLPSAENPLFPGGRLQSEEGGYVAPGIQKAADAVKDFGDAVGAVTNFAQADLHDDMSAGTAVQGGRAIDTLLKNDFDIYMGYAESPEDWDEAYEKAIKDIVEVANATYGENSGVAEQILAKINAAQQQYLQVSGNKSLTPQQAQQQIGNIQSQLSDFTGVQLPSVYPNQTKADEYRAQGNAMSPGRVQNPEFTAEQQQLADDILKRIQTTDDKDLKELAKKALGVEFEDNTYGAMGASHMVGNINEYANQLAYELTKMSPDDKDYAEKLKDLDTYTMLLSYISSVNQDALETDGALEGMLASNAGYLPQLREQTESRLPWLIGIGLFGAAVGGAPGFTTALKAANILGSVPYSYQSMYGAAFRDMLYSDNAANLSLDQMKSMAQDEAILSSIVEFGDTFTDTLARFPGAGKILRGFGGEKAAKTIFGQVLKFAGVSIESAAGEYGEEGLQEIISIANQNRAAGGSANGPDSGLWGLAKEFVDVASGMVTSLTKGEGLSNEQIKQVHEAGMGGAYIGLPGAAVGGAVNNLVTAPMRNGALQFINNLDKNKNRAGIYEGVINGTTSEENAKEFNKIAKGKGNDEFKSGLDAFEKHDENNNFKGVKKGDVLLDAESNPVGTVTKANGKTVTIELAGEDGKKTTENINIVGLHGYLDAGSQTNQILDNGGKIVSSEVAEDAAAYKADEKARQEAAEAKRQEILQKAEERRKAEEEAKAAAANAPKATTDSGTGTVAKPHQPQQPTKKAPTPGKPASMESTDSGTGTAKAAQPKTVYTSEDGKYSIVNNGNGYSVLDSDGNAVGTAKAYSDAVEIIRKGNASSSQPTSQKAPTPGKPASNESTDSGTGTVQKENAEQPASETQDTKTGNSFTDFITNETPEANSKFEGTFSNTDYRVRYVGNEREGDSSTRQYTISVKGKDGKYHTVGENGQPTRFYADEVANAVSKAIGDSNKVTKTPGRNDIGTAKENYKDFNATISIAQNDLAGSMDTEADYHGQTITVEHQLGGGYSSHLENGISFGGKTVEESLGQALEYLYTHETDEEWNKYEDQKRGETAQPETNPAESGKEGAQALADITTPEAPTGTPSKAEQYFADNPKKSTYTTTYKESTVKLKKNADGTYTVSMSKPRANGKGWTKSVDVVGTVSSIDEANKLVADEYLKKTAPKALTDAATGKKPNTSEIAPESPVSASPETGNSVPAQAQESTDTANETLNTGSEEKAKEEQPKTEEKPKTNAPVMTGEELNTLNAIRKNIKNRSEQAIKDNLEKASTDESKQKYSEEFLRQLKKICKEELDRRAEQTKPVTIDKKENRYLSPSTNDGVRYNNGRYRSAREAYEAAVKGRDLTHDQKVEIMKEILRDKFTRGTNREKLLATGDREIVLDNGLDNTVDGTNDVGKIIMDIRAEIIAQDKEASQKAQERAAEKAKQPKKNEPKTPNPIATATDQKRQEERNKAFEAKKNEKKSIWQTLNKIIRGGKSYDAVAEEDQPDSKLWQTIYDNAKILNVTREEGEKFTDFINRVYQQLGLTTNIDQFFGLGNHKSEETEVDIDSADETDRTTWQIDQAYNTANQGNEDDGKIFGRRRPSVHGSLDDSLRSGDIERYTETRLTQAKKRLTEFEESLQKQKEKNPKRKESAAQKAYHEILKQNVESFEEKLRIVRRHSLYQDFVSIISGFSADNEAGVPEMESNNGTVINPTLYQVWEYINGRGRVSTTVNYEDSIFNRTITPELEAALKEVTGKDDVYNIRASELLDMDQSSDFWKEFVDGIDDTSNTAGQLTEEQRLATYAIRDAIDELALRGKIGIREETGVAYTPEETDPDLLRSETASKYGTILNEKQSKSFVNLSADEQNKLWADLESGNEEQKKEANRLRTMLEISESLKDVIDYVSEVDDDGNVHVEYDWQALNSILGDPLYNNRGFEISRDHIPELIEVLEAIIPTDPEDGTVEYRTEINDQGLLTIRRAHNKASTYTILEKLSGGKSFAQRAKRLAQELFRKGHIDAEGTDYSNPARRNSPIIHDIINSKEFEKRVQQERAKITDPEELERFDKAIEKTRQSGYFDGDETYYSYRGVRNLMLDTGIKQLAEVYNEAVRNYINGFTDLDGEQHAGAIAEQTAKLEQLQRKAENIRNSKKFMDNWLVNNDKLEKVNAQIAEVEKDIENLNKWLEMIDSYDITVFDAAMDDFGREIFGDPYKEDSFAHAFKNMTIKGMLNAETYENAAELVDWLNHQKEEDEYRYANGEFAGSSRYAKEFGEPTAEPYRFTDEQRGVAPDTREPVESTRIHPMAAPSRPEILAEGLSAHDTIRRGSTNSASASEVSGTGENVSSRTEGQGSAIQGQPSGGGNTGGQVLHDHATGEALLSEQDEDRRRKRKEQRGVIRQKIADAIDWIKNNSPAANNFPLDRKSRKTGKTRNVIEIDDGIFFAGKTKGQLTAPNLDKTITHTDEDGNVTTRVSAVETTEAAQIVNLYNNAALDLGVGIASFEGTIYHYHGDYTLDFEHGDNFVGSDDGYTSQTRSFVDTADGVLFAKQPKTLEQVKALSKDVAHELTHVHFADAFGDMSLSQCKEFYENLFKRAGVDEQKATRKIRKFYDGTNELDIIDEVIARIAEADKSRFGGTVSSLELAALREALFESSEWKNSLDGKDSYEAVLSMAGRDIYQASDIAKQYGTSAEDIEKMAAAIMKARSLDLLPSNFKNDFNTKAYQSKIEDAFTLLAKGDPWGAQKVVYEAERMLRNPDVNSGYEGLWLRDQTAALDDIITQIKRLATGQDRRYASTETNEYSQGFKDMYTDLKQNESIQDYFWKKKQQEDAENASGATFNEQADQSRFSDYEYSDDYEEYENEYADAAEEDARLKQSNKRSAGNRKKHNLKLADMLDDFSVNNMSDEELAQRELESLYQEMAREPDFYDAQEEAEYREALAKMYRETDQISLNDKIHEVKWTDKDGKEHVRRFTTEGLAAAARAGGIASNEKQRERNQLDSEQYNNDEAMQEARESLEQNRGTARRTTAADIYGTGTAKERVDGAKNRLNREKPRSAFFNSRIYYRQHGKTNASMRNFRNVSQLGGHVSALLDGKVSFRSFNDYAESNKETPVVGVILDERMRKELAHVAALEEAAHNASSPEESAVTDYQHAAARAAAHLVARMEMVEKTERAKSNFDKLAKESGKSGNRNKLQNAMDWNKRMQISGDNFWRMMGNWDKNGNNDGYSYADDHNRSIAARISEEAKLKNCFTEAFAREKIDTNSQEFKDFISGKTMSKVKIEGHEISLMEAIKLMKIIDTLNEYDRVENKPDYTRLAYLDGFCFKDKNGQSVFVDIPGGFRADESTGIDEVSRESWLSDLSIALANEIFNNKVADAYYTATNRMYELASEDANKVFAKVNGYERYMYKYGKYTDIHYAKKNTHDIDFDYQNTDVTDVDDTASMKDRSRDAGGYIMVTPMSKSVDAYISQISNYIAFEEFGQRLNVLQNGLMSDGSLNRTIRETYGDQFDEWFDNYVKSMTLYKDRGKEMSKWDKGLQDARRLMMSGALVASVSVPFKQVSSFFDTFGSLDPRAVRKAFLTNPAGRRVKGINNYLYQARQNTISDPDYAELFGEKGLFSKARNVPILKNLVDLATKGTNMMDVNTVSNVYKACVYDVEMNTLPAERLYKNGKNFKEGLTAEGQFYVDSKFEQALLGSQPIFTPQARNELARTDNQFLKMFQTFRTQQTQNYNRMLQAMNEWKAAEKGDKGEAFKTLQQTVRGHIAASASLSLLTVASAALLHKHRRYKDDDDELDDEKLGKKFLYGMIESMAGNYLFVGDLTKWMIDLYNSKTDDNWDWKYSSKESQYFDIGKAHLPIPSSGAIGTAIQALNSVIHLCADVAENGWDETNILSARYVAGNMATAMGAPVNNIYTFMNGVYQWTMDGLYKITGDKKYDQKYDDFLTQLIRVDQSRQNRLVNAIMKNNDDKIDDFFENMGEDAFQKAVMYGALDRYKEGKINEQEWLEMLMNFGGKSYKDASSEVQKKKALIDSGMSQYNGIDGRDGRAKFYETYSNRFPSRESYKQFFTDVKNGKRDGKHNTYYTTYNKQQQAVSANQSSIIDRLNENIRAGNITYNTAKLIWEKYYGYSSSKWSAWQYVGK